MDREEVIKWLMIMKANLNSFPEVSNAKKIEALAEAIRLLKNEKSEEPSSSGKPNKSEIPTGSDDCISRQAVEDAMYDATRAMDLNYGQIMDYIDNLPPVTPQEPRWIPTSERLPKEDGEYYATIYDTDENYKYMDIAELEDGIWQYKDYVKVLAWMPLPEPYREVRE
jgi:hypothetical protein